MNPRQLALARFPGKPTLHPTGDTAVVAVRRIDLDADDYTSQLWLIPTDEGELRQLTYGWRDASPEYSPDGAWLAFHRAERTQSDQVISSGEAVLSREAAPSGGASHFDKAGPPAKVGKTQLWVMPTGGGEPKRLTNHPIGVESFAWSGDSTRIAFIARDPEPGRYGTVEGVGPDKEPPRRITRMLYRLDGTGFTGDRPRQIWVTDLAGSPIRITSGDIDHDEVSWNPSGDLLTFVAAGHPERDNDLRTDVWVCDADGGNRRALTAGGLTVGQPRFCPDSSAVVFTGSTTTPQERNGAIHNTSLWSVPADGSGTPIRLSDEERFNLNSPIEAGVDGVLFPNDSRGSVELLMFGYHGDPQASSEPQALMTGQRVVQAAAMVSTPAGPLIVATVGDPGTWGEVVLREWDGSERVLTDFNAGYRENAAIFPPQEITATAPDGYPVHGWVVRPSGDGPHPVLLLIHGGPFTQYSWQLFDEVQVYAGAGYAVLLSNPRGSSGYGQAHGRAIVGNVGEASTSDLMAILDETLKAPDLDGSRVGVLGGSHGGFMTTWLAAHEGHRFRAAVSERAVNAIDSFTGSSDIGWFFGEDLYGPDPEQRRKQSPLTYAGDIDVPMLIIHSEQDWRCPIEQAQRLYVALKHHGATVEMLLFPGEGHELSRTGLPSHRVARFDAILDWFHRYV